MERQHTTSHSLKSIAGAALVGLGFVILLEKLDEPAAQWMTNLLGAAARETITFSRPRGLASFAGLCLRSPAV